MTDNIEQLFKTPDMFGPEKSGNSVICEGRIVPNMTVYHRGDELEFVLDSRLSYQFPKSIAYDVIHFAANAMAIGAGFPCFTAEKKVQHFATPCSAIHLGDIG